MIDIKFLRENPEVVKENIRKKFQDSKIPMVDEVIQLEAESSDEIGGLWFVVSTASPDKLRDYPYTLEFFDGGGALLGTYTNPAGEEGTE